VTSNTAAVIFILFNTMARQAPLASATAPAEMIAVLVDCSPANHVAARTVLCTSGNGIAAWLVDVLRAAATPVEPTV
jgi:hypothetical protein